MLCPAEFGFIAFSVLFETHPHPVFFLLCGAPPVLPLPLCPRSLVHSCSLSGYLSPPPLADRVGAQLQHHENWGRALPRPPEHPDEDDFWPFSLNIPGYTHRPYPWPGEKAEVLPTLEIWRAGEGLN